MAQPSNRAERGDRIPPPACRLARLGRADAARFRTGLSSAASSQRPAGYVDVLRVQGNNLTLKGRFAEGLQIDKRWCSSGPNDALAHYNLACSYALLKRPEQSLKTLRRAVELGYRDFRYMREDRDLDAVRHDPRFRQLLREYENAETVASGQWSKMRLLTSSTTDH